MRRFRDFLSRPATTAALLALALLLLLGSGVGGARAALSIESEKYRSQVDLNSITVALVENGEDRADGATLLTGLPTGKSFVIGKSYPEELCVKNTGAIDEYVRVTVYRYWLDASGAKDPDLDPAYIDLGLNLSEGGWSRDDSTGTKTEERTVLYYASVLEPEAVTPPFLKSVSINSKVMKMVTQKRVTDADGLTTITTTYTYNGKQFCIEVYVDAVQTHSKDHAKLSAWGVNK